MDRARRGPMTTEKKLGSWPSSSCSVLETLSLSVLACLLELVRGSLAVPLGPLLNVLASSLFLGNPLTPTPMPPPPPPPDPEPLGVGSSVIHFGSTPVPTHENDSSLTVLPSLHRAGARVAVHLREVLLVGGDLAAVQPGAEAQVQRQRAEDAGDDARRDEARVRASAAASALVGGVRGARRAERGDCGRRAALRDGEDRRLAGGERAAGGGTRGRGRRRGSAVGAAADDALHLAGDLVAVRAGEDRVLGAQVRRVVAGLEGARPTQVARVEYVHTRRFALGVWADVPAGDDDLAVAHGTRVSRPGRGDPVARVHLDPGEGGDGKDTRQDKTYKGLEGLASEEVDLEARGVRGAGDGGARVDAHGWPVSRRALMVPLGGGDVEDVQRAEVVDKGPVRPAGHADQDAADAPAGHEDQHAVGPLGERVRLLQAALGDVAEDAAVGGPGDAAAEGVDARVGEARTLGVWIDQPAVVSQSRWPPKYQLRPSSGTDSPAPSAERWTGVLAAVE
ncbi:hypothetical protein CTA1_8687 [Colletotrichum tanaceti]|uniref:Uncharacterized protein n=1 Tax=Colletotrichum tanaceti TaxID=1306861 RepID=A0A4U6XSF6_9PEZI|nr:hypothetical protein CTA1_8687 [Colletotrichum tanaceti]